jgi:hypothetical protein
MKASKPIKCSNRLPLNAFAARFGRDLRRPAVRALWRAFKVFRHGHSDRWRKKLSLMTGVGLSTTIANRKWTFARNNFARCSRPRFRGYFRLASS